MEKLSRFITTLSIMILFVAGTSWFILYVFDFIFSLSDKTLLISKTTFAIMPAILVITMIIGRKKYSKINSFFYILGSLWVPMFMYIFMIACILGVFFAISGDSFNSEKMAFYLFVATFVLFLYGIYNAQSPIIRKYIIKAPALRKSWGDKKIVLFSDSHLGAVRHESFMRKIAQMVNEQKPDIVFIAGDLIDGPAFPYKQGLAPLGDIKSTLGIFFSAGNHDEYNIEQSKFYNELDKYATVLNDKNIIVNDTQIIGIMYKEDGEKETKERLAQTGYDKNLPSIALLHDPRNTKALAESGVSLVLSGHTHGGQFFPVNLLVKIFYGKRMRGVSYTGKNAHFTSVGAGTAGPIFRLGVSPEIAVLEII